jgi:hypothetical protein
VTVPHHEVAETRTQRERDRMEEKQSKTTLTQQQESTPRHGRHEKQS